jgi:serine/threonine-protein kinase
VLAAAGTLVSAHAKAATARAVLVSARVNGGTGTRGAPETLADVGEREFAAPRYAPDGRRIVFQVGPGFPTALWVYHLSARTFTRIAPATAEGSTLSAAWTPDGRRLLFTSTPGVGRDTWGIWTQPADGGAPPQLLFTERGTPEGTAVAPDGRTLLYAIVSDTGGARRDLRAVDLPDGAPRPWLATPFDEFAPAFSPDGRWVAYVSDETGRREVYVRPFAGASGRVQVSAEGGTEPCWSPDGRRLFYRSGRRMVAAHVGPAGATPGLAVTARAVVFDGDYLAGGRVRDYDVAPDGRHVVMLQPTPGAAEVVVAVDWLGEVRDRLRGER